MNDSIFVAGVLCLIVVLSEWLVRTTFLRQIGTALLVILVTALVANLGIIPAGSPEEDPVLVYDRIFSDLAPLAIFLLLLPVNLKDILKAGGSMISMFLVGSLATAIGVLAGMWAIDGATRIGPQFAALAGMFTGTYTGGSVNFNTLALSYDIVREGSLYTGSIVVDNIITTVWMVATLALPRLLRPFWGTGGSVRKHSSRDDTAPDLGIEIDTESLHPMDLGMTLGLGLLSVWASGLLAEWTPDIPAALYLTAMALVLAQWPVIQRLRGVRTLGMFAVYLFLAVIGAFCDFTALGELGSLGITLLVFALVAVSVHGLITFGVARIFGVDPDIAAVASQANVGGGTSALALARSLGREDLVLPGILVGSLGYAVGTFLGFWVADGWMSLL